jgi:hypothetical protein
MSKIREIITKLDEIAPIPDPEKVDQEIEARAKNLAPRKGEVIVRLPMPYYDFAYMGKLLDLHEKYSRAWTYNHQIGGEDNKAVCYVITTPENAAKMSKAITKDADYKKFVVASIPDNSEEDFSNVPPAKALVEPGSLHHSKTIV